MFLPTKTSIPYEWSPQDWKNVYVREPTAKALLHGTSALTQFGRICERLGIQIIAAGSPEATEIQLATKRRTAWGHF
jgi:hypothetical protein